MRVACAAVELRRAAPEKASRSRGGFFMLAGRIFLICERDFLAGRIKCAQRVELCGSRAMSRMYFDFP